MLPVVKRYGCISVVARCVMIVGLRGLWEASGTGGSGHVRQSFQANCTL